MSSRDTFRLPYRLTSFGPDMLIALDKNLKEIERVLGQLMTYEKLFGKPANEVVEASQEDWDSAVALANAIINGQYTGGTFISGTSIVSPIIAGANGYFSKQVTVGENGPIVLDGENKEIRLQDGARIVGEHGVLSTLKFESAGQGAFGDSQGWGEMGIWTDGMNMDQGIVSVPIFIPSNFEVTSAKLYTYAMPTYYENPAWPDWGWHATKWKQSRNLRLYYSTGTEGFRDWIESSGTNFVHWRAGINITSTVWGATEWSPTLSYSGNNPLNTENKIDIKAGDIKSSLPSAGNSRVFFVRTTDDDYENDFEHNQGLGKLVAFIEGYATTTS